MVSAAPLYLILITTAMLEVQNIYGIEMQEWHILVKR